MNNQKQENLKQLFKETFLQVTTDSESFIQFLNQKIAITEQGKPGRWRNYLL